MGNKHEIRPYREDDFAFCNALVETNMASYFEQDGTSWDEALFRHNIKKGTVSIYWIEEERAGFIQSSERDGEAYVNIIQVVAHSRNQGIGRVLMEYAESLFPPGKYRYVSLKVYKGSPAIRLYQKLGYMVVGEEDHKYVMKKKLI